jgi:hypothetical protein
MTKKTEPSAGNGSRREFAQKIVVAGAAAVFGISDPPMVATDTSTRDEAASHFQRILQKYGDRLSNEQETRLRKILAYNEKMMEAIRNFPLENGQPTASVLKFYPDPESRKQ